MKMFTSILQRELKRALVGNYYDVQVPKSTSIKLACISVAVSQLDAALISLQTQEDKFLRLNDRISEMLLFIEAVIIKYDNCTLKDVFSHIDIFEEEVEGLSKLLWIF
ncbi:hypothetical protein T07_13033 [Trichinella nelsoni]|uniref:Uncharacterized protein n=1 Tax=Trichinella nelsoni TaxID=6336 RepID=A0A0V0SF85_9BILA|nr:hypothetical protein T07_13033 [Trichinella nelsoni]